MPHAVLPRSDPEPRERGQDVHDLRPDVRERPVGELRRAYRHGVDQRRRVHGRHPGSAPDRGDRPRLGMRQPAGDVLALLALRERDPRPVLRSQAGRQRSLPSFARHVPADGDGPTRRREPLLEDLRRRLPLEQPGRVVDVPELRGLRLWGKGRQPRAGATVDRRRARR